ncbi:MAG: hypothetical protein AMXMBFR34_04810 [Myxococcaceae bacterium]
MPQQSFAFEPNGPKRLTLSWGAFWKNFTVSVDSNQVAALTPEEVKTGKDVRLPDGSTLRIHLKTGFGNAGLELTRDGKPLPGAANDPQSMVKSAAYLLYFLAALNAVLGAAVVAFHVTALENMGLGVGNIILGFIFAVGGYFTMQRSMVALGLSIALYAIDGIAGLVMAAEAGGRPGVGGIFIRVFFIIILARGITGIRMHKAAEKAPAA